VSLWPCACNVRGPGLASSAVLPVHDDDGVMRYALCIGNDYG
jgi:hypothetical protein